MRCTLTTEELEAKFERAQTELDLQPVDKILFRPFLGTIKNWYLPEYEHCLRVGLKCKEVAEETGIVEPIALYRCGALHDIGKSGIRKELLSKRTGWSKADSREMHEHIDIGCRMLRDLHDFEYWVILNSHTFDFHHPSKPTFSESHTERDKLYILNCARQVNLIDFYDAATHRLNDRNTPGTPRLLTDDEVRRVTTEQNMDCKHLIDKLYSKGIF
ncbi:HD domain protein [uncultured archaeon]|nr:HD domain protein [uncultured archaeon]